MYKRSVSEESFEFVKIYDSQTQQRIILTTKYHGENAKWRKEYSINMPFDIVDLDKDNTSSFIPSAHCATNAKIHETALRFAEYATTLWVQLEHGSLRYKKLHVNNTTTRSKKQLIYPYDYLMCCVNARSRTPTAYLSFLMLFRRQRVRIGKRFIQEACQTQRTSMARSSLSTFPNFDKFGSMC